MAINKKLIHFKNFSDFNSKKLSANENNTQYTLGIEGAVTNGSPDILYQSICYIKDTKQQWTHGQLYDGSKSDTPLNETDPVFLASPAATITEANKQEWNNKQDAISDLAAIRNGASKGATAVQPSSLATVATSGSYNDLSNKPTIPAAVTESTVSGWGFTKNTGTYSKPSSGIPKSDLASAVQTSLGKADTALQSYTEQYKGTVTGVKINGTTKSQSNGIVDLGTVITAHQTLKTINGESIVGSGDIIISGGSSGANVQAVDTGDVIDDVNVDYATKTYVDGLIGDINSVLESIISGGTNALQENLILYGTLTRAAEYKYFYSLYPVESDITITADWEHPINGSQTLVCHISKGNTKIDETLTAAYEFTNVVITPESDSKYIYTYNS